MKSPATPPMKPPMAKVDAMVELTLTPIRLAVSWSWATARILRPTLLWVTSVLTARNRIAVTIRRTTSNAVIWAPKTVHEKFDVMGWAVADGLWPKALPAKFERKNDAPIAEIR